VGTELLGMTGAPIMLAHRLSLVFIWLHLFWYSRGGVQLGSFCTAATNRPIVLLGDYDDGEIGGMMIGRGN
jgi:hypothetical protein